MLLNFHCANHFSKLLHNSMLQRSHLVSIIYKLTWFCPALEAIRSGVVDNLITKNLFDAPLKTKKKRLCCAAFVALQIVTRESYIFQQLFETFMT